MMNMKRSAITGQFIKATTSKRKQRNPSIHDSEEVKAEYRAYMADKEARHAESVKDLKAAIKRGILLQQKYRAKAARLKKGIDDPDTDAGETRASEIRFYSQLAQQAQRTNAEIRKVLRRPRPVKR